VQSILGYSPEEWVEDPSFWFERVVEEDQQTVSDEMSRCVEAGIDFNLDYRMVARDGHTVWLHDEAIVLSRDDRGRVTQFQGILHDVTERHLIIDRLREANEQRRRLLAGIVSAQEEERRRIAGDIHDDPIQKMTAVAMRLDLVRRDHPELASDQGFASLTSSVQLAIARLRHLMFDLRPYMLDRDGLVTALHAYLADQEALGAGPVYSLDDRLKSEPHSDIRVTMYRIVQEALINVRKHARATRADVRLLDEGDGYLIEVCDDGVGFSPEGTVDSPLGHLGLTAMRERAEMAGGWLKVSSDPGRGTTVRVWLPSRDRGSGIQLAS
jgi:PAS domain S-box-containing protein